MWPRPDRQHLEEHPSQSLPHSRRRRTSIWSRSRRHRELAVSIRAGRSVRPQTNAHSSPTIEIIRKEDGGLHINASSTTGCRDVFISRRLPECRRTATPTRDGATSSSASPTRVLRRPSNSGRNTLKKWTPPSSSPQKGLPLKTGRNTHGLEDSADADHGPRPRPDCFKGGAMTSMCRRRARVSAESLLRRRGRITTPRRGTSPWSDIKGNLLDLIEWKTDEIRAVLRGAGRSAGKVKVSYQSSDGDEVSQMLNTPVIARSAKTCRLWPPPRRRRTGITPNEAGRGRKRLR